MVGLWTLCQTNHKILGWVTHTPPPLEKAPGLTHLNAWPLFLPHLFWFLSKTFSSFLTWFFDTGHKAVHLPSQLSGIVWSFTFRGQIAKPPKFILNKANSFTLINNSNILKEDLFGSELWSIYAEMSFVEICLVCQLLWTVRINRDVWFFIFAAFLWHQNTCCDFIQFSGFCRFWYQANLH